MSVEAPAGTSITRRLGTRLVTTERQEIDSGPGKALHLYAHPGADPLYVSSEATGAPEQTVEGGERANVADHAFIWSAGRTRLTLIEHEAA